MLSHKIHDANLHTFLFYHFGLFFFSLLHSLSLYWRYYFTHSLCLRQKYSFLIHLKHLGCIQNEYTVGTNVLYGQNIKNNSNRVYKESKCEYDVDSKKEQHNGWKATYAYIHIHTHTIQYSSPPSHSTIKRNPKTNIVLQVHTIEILSVVKLFQRGLEHFSFLSTCFIYIL